VKTLLLSGGDLVVGPGGHATVSGSSKVRQDLALALGEDYGHDRYHPEWGSVITRFLGAPITPETEMAVYSEVARVLGTYVALQKAALVRDSLQDQVSRFSLGDVVQEVTDITAKIGIDTIFISVTIRTSSGESVTLNRTVGL
jgi:phage baseplate assembly protein W